MDNSSQIPTINKAISLIRGVSGVSVHKEKPKVKKKTEKTIPSDIQKLMGIASEINKMDVNEDDRLAYLLNK